jgi:hypothetical protein
MTAAARFEFRLFDHDLGGLTRQVRERAEPRDYRESLEVYLNLPGRLDLNLKLRDRRFELKTLVGETAGLQQWQPAWKSAPPLAPAALAASLGLDLPGAGRDPALTTAREAIDWLTGPAVGAGRVTVFKRRLFFEIDGCAVELDALLMNGAAMASAAFEADDAARLGELRARLGLGDEENVSYVLAVDRLLGRAPLPRRGYYAHPAVG